MLVALEWKKDTNFIALLWESEFLDMWKYSG